MAGSSRLCAQRQSFLLSMPPFLTSLFFVFLRGCHWLAAVPGGMGTARHLVVPAAALGLPIAAMFERLQSQAVREVVDQPYVLAALARGVPRFAHLVRDGLKACSSPAGIGLWSGRRHPAQRIVCGRMVDVVAGLGPLLLEALRARESLSRGRVCSHRIAAARLRHASVGHRSPIVDSPVLATKAGYALVGLFVAGAIAAPFIAPHSNRNGLSGSAERTADLAAHHRPRRTHLCAVHLRVDAGRPSRVAVCAGPIQSGSAAMAHSGPSRLDRRHAGRRSCYLAPTALAAMCSAGCCSAHASRWRSRYWPALGSIAMGALVGSISGYAGGVTDDCPDEADRCRPDPADDVRGTCAAGRAAARHRAVDDFCLSCSDFRCRRCSVRRPRRCARSSEAKREQEYAVAAISLGAGHARVLVRHLLPAAGGFLAGGRLRC